MIKLGDFSLLLTPDYILNENHYLKTGGLKPKGKGVEVIMVFDNIEQIYQHVLEKIIQWNLTLKCNLGE
ncbi:hypothetical protein AAGG43_23790 [Bacillus paranthracis]